LGLLEAEANGDILHLGATKQRALLAVLLLHANEFVSHDRLIAALWGETAPAGAGHNLQVYVSELRKVLSAGGRDLLVTQPGGYLIKLEPGQLDLERFGMLFDEARSALAHGASSVAAGKLREALALWRGEPLADLQFEPFAQPEVERLEQLRTAALEERIEADLEAGLATELLPELEALTAQHPLRERLRRQLMVALYRAGRQAEALQVYREHRVRSGSGICRAPNHLPPTSALPYEGRFTDDRLSSAFSPASSLRRSRSRSSRLGEMDRAERRSLG
jgi:DNA-binding SARP family transcriptional activator